MYLHHYIYIPYNTQQHTTAMPRPTRASASSTLKPAQLGSLLVLVGSLRIGKDNLFISRSGYMHRAVSCPSCSHEADARQTNTPTHHRMDGWIHWHPTSPRAASHSFSSTPRGVVICRYDVVCPKHGSGTRERRLEWMGVLEVSPWHPSVPYSPFTRSEALYASTRGHHHPLHVARYMIEAYLSDMCGTMLSCLPLFMQCGQGLAMPSTHDNGGKD